MTPALAAVVAGILCGLGGLLVPALIRRIPESPERDADRPSYADVAAAPGLRWRSPVLCLVAGAVVGWAVGWDRALVGLVPLVPVGVALAEVDLRTRLLPRLVVLPATGALLLLAGADAAVTGEPDRLVRGVLGLVVARSVYWVLWRIHSAGMGFGDVRLAGLLGLALGYLGWAELAVGTYAAFLVFGLPALVLALVRRDRGMLRTTYPFGPAMLVGALLGALLGPSVYR